jgi:hypothetical protein
MRKPEPEKKNKKDSKYNRKLIRKPEPEIETPINRKLKTEKETGTGNRNTIKPEIDTWSLKLKSKPRMFLLLNLNILFLNHCYDATTLSIMTPSISLKSATLSIMTVRIQFGYAAECCIFVVVLVSLSEVLFE